MSQLFPRLGRFVGELKRRRVIRVAGVYAVVAFVVWQVADVVVEPLRLPEWALTLVIVLTLLGLPVALVLAWAFELTPEGIERASSEPEDGTTTGPLDETTDEEETPAPAARGFLRRPSVWFATGLAVALLGAYVIADRTGPGPADEELAPDRVAVFPFEVRGAEELDYLGEGMVELLARSLDGAGPLEAVDWSALLVQLREGAPEEGAYVDVGPDQGAEVAAGFGAGSFVLGSILRVGEEIHLGARWYSADGERIGRHEVTAEGEDEIQEAIDALSRVVISELTGGEADPRGRLAAETTSSVDALRAYLEGQAARRAMDLPGAQEAFERAVDADPDFALAHLGLSWAADWEVDLEAKHSAAERAVELAEGLPDRDRDLIEAQYAYAKGRAEEAEALYRRLVEAHPDDVDAWYWLGETLLHFNHTRGRSVVEAREPLERALELDPSNSEPLLHLIELAALEQDLETVDSLTADAADRNLSEEWHLSFREARAFLFGEGSVAEPDELRSFGAGTTAFRTLYGLGRIEEVEELSRLHAAAAQDPAMEAEARASIADFHAAQGKLTGARDELKAVADLDAATHLIHRARLAVLPWPPENERQEEERDDLVERLEAWDADAVPEGFMPLLPALPTVLPPLRLYLLGLLRAETGDLSAAETLAEELRDMEPPEFFPTLTSDLSRALLAEVALQRGETEKALDHLEAMELQGEPMYLHTLYSGARERFLRAELLAEAGRFDEALGWYESLPSTLDADARPYLAPAHLGRARALEELGREEEAAEPYEWFVELWEDADEPLQPQVEEARQRLRDLTGAVTDPDGSR